MNSKDFTEENTVPPDQSLPTACWPNVHLLAEVNDIQLVYGCGSAHQALGVVFVNQNYLYKSIDTQFPCVVRLTPSP